MTFSKQSISFLAKSSMLEHRLHALHFAGDDRCIFLVAIAGGGRAGVEQAADGDQGLRNSWVTEAAISPRTAIFSPWIKRSEFRAGLVGSFRPVQEHRFSIAAPARL
jgi:hypothetical protein